MWPFKEPTQADLLVREPGLTSRIRELRLLQTSLSETERWKVDLGAALNRAEEALPQTSKVATAYDAVWRALHHARHLLCEHGDVNQLIQVASEIRADLAYHPERDKKEKALDEIIRELQSDKDEVPAARRRELLSLSHEAADDREGVWRRANRLLERRMRASLWLLTVLPLCAAILPFAFGERGRSDHLAWTQEFFVKWLRGSAPFVTVMVFGALGGVMSILVGQSSAKATTLEHHIELKAAKLRWSIGAASALTMYLLLLSEVIRVGDLKTPWLSPMTLILCLVAGFSERLVVGQLDRLSNAVDDKSDKENKEKGS